MIAPSLLAADFMNLEKSLDILSGTGVKWLHLDIMDGHFVPNITFGPELVKQLRQKTNLLLDCHLMIEHPEAYIKQFAESGADLITVHVETCTHLHKVIQMIHEYGCQAGVVLNPATSLSSLDYILEDVEVVLLMSVNPGFGGQSFISSSLRKIRELKSLRDEKNLKTIIEVDGGICLENIAEVKKAGADLLVAGSAIFNKKNPREAVKELLKSLDF